MTHSVEFAIRVPTGFDPSTARIEAQTYTTPLLTFTSSSSAASSSEGGIVGDSPLPKVFSLASVESNVTGVYLAVLKAGTFDSAATVVRIVNPSNLEASAKVNLSPLLFSSKSGARKIMPASALEVPSPCTLSSQLAS